MSYTEPVGDTWKYHPEYNRMAEFLGIGKSEREDLGVAQKLSYLRDWAGESSKIDTALWRIRQVAKRMGVNTQGKTLVNDLYQYVRLSNVKPPTLKRKTVKPKEQPAPAVDPEKIARDAAKTVGREIAKALKEKEPKPEPEPPAPEPSYEYYTSWPTFE